MAQSHPLTPVCATCKRPLVRTSEQFWACESPGCRGLVLAGTVEDALRKSAPSSERKSNLIEV